MTITQTIKEAVGLASHEQQEPQSQSATLLLPIGLFLQRTSILTS